MFTFEFSLSKRIKNTVSLFFNKLSSNKKALLAFILNWQRLVFIFLLVSSIAILQFFFFSLKKKIFMSYTPIVILLFMSVMTLFFIIWSTISNKLETVAALITYIFLFTIFFILSLSLHINSFCIFAYFFFLLSLSSTYLNSCMLNKKNYWYRSSYFSLHFSVFVLLLSFVFFKSIVSFFLFLEVLTTLTLFFIISYEKNVEPSLINPMVWSSAFFSFILSVSIIIFSSNSIIVSTYFSYLFEDKSSIIFNIFQVVIFLSLLLKSGVQPVGLWLLSFYSNLSLPSLAIYVLLFYPLKLTLIMLISHTMLIPSVSLSFLSVCLLFLFFFYLSFYLKQTNTSLGLIFTLSTSLTFVLLIFFSMLS